MVRLRDMGALATYLIDVEIADISIEHVYATVGTDSYCENRHYTVTKGMSDLRVAIGNLLFPAFKSYDDVMTFHTAMTTIITHVGYTRVATGEDEIEEWVVDAFHKVQAYCKLYMTAIGGDIQ